MKVNMNQKPEKKPDKKPDIKKQKREKTPTPAPTPSPDKAGGGNVYKEASKAYLDKMKAELAGGGIFRKNKFWIILGVLLLIIFLSVNGNLNNKKTYLMTQIRHMSSELGNLNDAISDVEADLEEQAKINAIKLTEKEEELAMNDARTQGEHVAYLQNKYRSLDISTQRDVYAEIAKELEACFGEKDKNARSQWYLASKGIPGKWEFASQASFYGNTAKVLWLCYADEDRSLLAYCIAEYNADTKLFSKVDWKMTSYAVANIGSDEPIDDTEHISSIQDALNEIAGGNNTPDASEDFDDETINNNNDVSDGRDSYKESVSNGAVDGEEYDGRYDPGLNGSSSPKPSTSPSPTPSATPTPTPSPTPEPTPEQPEVEGGYYDDDGNWHAFADEGYYDDDGYWHFYDEE